MRLNKTQKAAVAALEDIKARDITVLDTRPLTAIYDSLIVATAESARQTKALARHVRDKVKDAGGQVLSIEGEETGEWVLVDCTDLVVHIMLPTTRALYNLEELWTAPAHIKPARAISPPKAASRSAPAKASAKSSAKTPPKRITSMSPAAKKPAAKKPAAKRPTSKSPVATTPATQKVTAKKPAAKKPAAKKPSATKVAASKKPAAKKTVAKPVVKVAVKPISTTKATPATPATPRPASKRTAR